MEQEDHFTEELSEAIRNYTRRLRDAKMLEIPINAITIELLDRSGTLYCQYPSVYKMSEEWLLRTPNKTKSVK